MIYKEQLSLLDGPAKGDSHPLGQTATPNTPPNGSGFDVHAWLVKTGRVGPDGLTRKARPRRCDRCKAPTLAGLDDEPLGIPRHCDPVLVTARGEAVGLLLGRYSARLHRAGDALVLDYRDAAKITGDSADHADVVLEHKCNSPPILTELRKAEPSDFVMRVRRIDYDHADPADYY